MMQPISPHVWMWQEIHGEARGEPYPWNSYVIDVPDWDILALVDPLDMSEDVAQEIEHIGTPTHILLTCDYHLRSSETYRKRWGCKIWVNEAEVDRYDVAIDGTFLDGQRLWNFIELIFVPGVKFLETAFRMGENRNVLIMGDLLAGERKDQGIPKDALAICGPQYIPDLRQARHSLSRLLDYEFEVMCFAHGTPVWEGAKEKLERYLNDDQIWQVLEDVKQVRGPQVRD